MAYSNSMCRQSSMPTSILIPGPSSCGGIPAFLTRKRNSCATVLPYERCIVTLTAYRSRTLMPWYVSYGS